MYTAAVALEGRPQMHVLQRSRNLSAGYRWRILGTFTVLLASYVALAIPLGLAISLLDTWYSATIVDCIFDVASAVFWVHALVLYLGIIAIKRTRCQRCGFSLIGNVTGTCPECGEAVPESNRSYTNLP